MGSGANVALDQTPSYVSGCQIVQDVKFLCLAVMEWPPVVLLLYQ